MNLKRKLLVLTGALGIGVSQPSAADCCNDFWSCAAAVATAGASCAIDAARQEITSFVTRVRSVIDKGKRDFEATMARLGSDIEGQLRAAEQQFAEDTRKIDAVLQSAVGRNVGPEAQAEYARAVQRLTELANEAHQRQAAMQESLRLGRATSASGQDRVRQTFQAVFLAPLSGLIAPLVAAIDPVAAVTTIAVLGPQVDNILRMTEQRMTAETNGYRSQMEPKVAEADRLVGEVAQRSREAQDLQIELQKLAQNPTAGNVAELRRLMSGRSAPGARLASKVPVKGTAAAKLETSFQTVKVSLIPKLRADLQGTVTAAGAAKPKRSSVDITPFQNRVRSELDRIWSGKPPAAAQQETARLLAEARQRYASNPAILEKLERFLAEQASARGAGTAPTPAKVALAPGAVANASPTPTPPALTAPATPPPNARYVDCAVPRLRADVTTRLPEGWWYTPTEGVIRNLRVQTAGNETLLVCLYQAFDGQVAVMRKPPAGARDCRADQAHLRFVCR